MSKANDYQKLKKQGLTDAEIAESFVLPHGLSKKEKEKADKAFAEERKKRLPKK